MRLSAPTHVLILAVLVGKHKPDRVYNCLQAAQQREEWRVASGASTVNSPECSLRVSRSDEDEPEIQARPETSQDTPGHQLVSEMMILANEAAARTGALLMTFLMVL